MLAEFCHAGGKQEKKGKNIFAFERSITEGEIHKFREVECGLWQHIELPRDMTCKHFPPSFPCARKNLDNNFSSASETLIHSTMMLAKKKLKRLHTWNIESHSSYFQSLRLGIKSQALMTRHAFDSKPSVQCSLRFIPPKWDAEPVATPSSHQ